MPKQKKLRARDGKRNCVLGRNPPRFSLSTLDCIVLCKTRISSQAQASSGREGTPPASYPPTPPAPFPSLRSQRLPCPSPGALWGDLINCHSREKFCFGAHPSPSPGSRNHSPATYSIETMLSCSWDSEGAGVT